MRVQPFANPVMNRPVLKPQPLQFGQEITPEDLAQLQPGSIITFTNDRGEEISLNVHEVTPQPVNVPASRRLTSSGWYDLPALSRNDDYIIVAKDTSLHALVEPRRYMILLDKEGTAFLIGDYEEEPANWHQITSVTHPD